MRSSSQRDHWTRGPSGVIAVSLLLLLSTGGLLASLSRAPEPGPASLSAPSARIDLNTVTEAQLDALPNIGPRRAAAIIAHRQSHGPFHSLDNLSQVPGIGPRTLEKLRPFLFVTPDPSPAASASSSAPR